MHKVFKLSLNLLLDQVLGSFGGAMFILLIPILFGESIKGAVVFFLVTFVFYFYIVYITSFKAGFHDENRRNNPNNKFYIIKGALAGLISSIPLMVIMTFYFIASFSGNEAQKWLFRLYFRIFNMFFAWPAWLIFPNHFVAIMFCSFIPLIFLPMFGYILGYKNFVISTEIVNIFKKK